MSEKIKIMAKHINALEIDKVRLWDKFIKLNEKVESKIWD